MMTLELHNMLIFVFPMLYHDILRGPVFRGATGGLWLIMTFIYIYISIYIQMWTWAWMMKGIIYNKSKPSEGISDFVTNVCGASGYAGALSMTRMNIDSLSQDCAHSIANSQSFSQTSPKSSIYQNIHGYDSPGVWVYSGVPTYMQQRIEFVYILNVRN